MAIVLDNPHAAGPRPIRASARLRWSAPVGRSFNVYARRISLFKRGARCHRRRRVRQRSGYVLIMTLVMIVIAALSLAGLARRSLLLANESIIAQRELQRYWGTQSCRHLLLDQANAIFENLEAPHAEGELPWPAPRQLTASVTLAGMTYRLWLGDEDAKLNLNTLTAHLPRQRRAMLSQLTDSQNLLQLTPDTSFAFCRETTKTLVFKLGADGRC